MDHQDELPKVKGRLVCVNFLVTVVHDPEHLFLEESTRQRVGSWLVAASKPSDERVPAFVT